MTNTGQIAVKSITFSRDEREVVIKIARTSKSNDIIQTIQNVFNLPIESEIILLEHGTGEILCNASPIFFWTNPAVTPTYRIIIRGEPIPTAGRLQTVLVQKPTTIQNRNAASILVPTYEQTPQVDVLSVIKPLSNIAIAPLYPFSEEMQRRYNRLPDLAKYQVNIFYHVTSEYCKEKIEKEKMLLATQPNDCNYDKGLVHPGIYGVFGNTNICENGSLPDVTQYPRNSAKGLNPRINIPLNELCLHVDMYEMFFVWQEGIQLLVAFFREDHPQIEYMRASLLRLDKADNKILSYNNQSWGCPLYKSKTEGMFTNVFIASHIPLAGITYQWDSARKI